MKSLLLVPTEIPVDTIRGLSNLEIYEKQSATFECEFNKANLEAKWFQAGDHITPDWIRFKPEVDGKVHRLHISEAEMDDAAKYSCRANGKKTSGTLTVKGSHLLPISACIRQVINSLAIYS